MYSVQIAFFIHMGSEEVHTVNTHRPMNRMGSIACSVAHSIARRTAENMVLAMNSLGVRITPHTAQLILFPFRQHDSGRHGSMI